ncbi:TonB-dependent receptor [Massilia solisilvae]|uniref:TonB-dependent receptor n=1 Tax=Massilia solisilvae TaxID=1811225 RepID=A0ABT2BNB6_9BURK|nr:TonB-dependent receptor [Massilia solisilvae]MCS0609967.1 TonB-dependent receptor [Massilia solisilvae]
MSRLIPIACLALLGTAGGQALAQNQVAPAGAPAQEVQDSAAKAPPADAKPEAAQRRRPPVRAQKPATTEGDAKDTQQVVVSGSRDIDVRRASTAAKMIFGREELDRNGDSNIGEVLKRLPGVTMGGAPGRGGGGVRMRGLGNGYTQMLVNGERPPPGFSLESIPPDQVERIEIMRGPVAEHSTQAIAGTINVVLREGYTQKDKQIRVADNIEQGRHGANVSATIPGKAGNLTWMLNIAAMQNRQHNESDSRDIDALDDGTVLREQLIHVDGNGKSRGVHLSPRLSYKFDNGDTLNFQPFIVANRNDNVTDSTVDQTIGLLPPEFVFQNAVSHSSGHMARGFGNWVHKMDGGAKLDVKFSGGVNHNESEGVRQNYDAAERLNRVYNDTDTIRHRSFSTGGKYSRPLGQGHNFAAGWDAEAAHLSQVHVAEGDNNPLYDESGANLTADTRRVALFAQDEWDITSQWSAYFGLRWEGIRTTSNSVAREVKNTSSVFSPVLHTVYRIPGHDKDQVRASLTQSYKAPALNDMIAAPSFSSDNRATRPDRSGNPNLKPELAKGIDLAYEHYLTRSGILSASAFVRDIDNLMRRQTTLQQTSIGPRWVSTPTNIGHARTSGIELEAKFQLAEFFPNGPNVDVRSNYSHFWSKVDGIPGPDNRLDQQAKQTANVGADYRMKGLPLTLGANLNWTPVTVIRSAVQELDTTGMKRQLDAYGLWRFGPNTQLRVSGNNLFARKYETARVVDTNGMLQAIDTLARTYTSVRVQLELKI